MNEKLVSVLTPCHNSGEFLHRLLDSVLEQSWPEIEMILVDNASFDDTAAVIRSYESKFSEKGYPLKYILQEDAGPSGGINRGLKEIHGEYLYMIDSDDWLSGPDSIATFIRTFEELDDSYAMIKCPVRLIREIDMSDVGTSVVIDYGKDRTKWFEDCLFETNGYFYSPISYIVKVSCLRELTGMDIFTHYHSGQNKQICLPLHYAYDTFVLQDDTLGCYLIRENSVSHGGYAKFPVLEELYEMYPAYIDSIFSDIPMMPESERESYRRRFLRMQTMRIYRESLVRGNSKDIKHYREVFRETYGSPTFREKLSLGKTSLKRILKKIIRRDG